MNEVLIHDEAADEGDAPGVAEAQTTGLGPVVNAILGTAVAAAAKRAGAADIAHGLIAGLRVLRSTAEADAGYTMGTAIDTAVRTRLLAENLSVLRSTGRKPEPAPLPPPGPGAAIALAIFASAAETCLTVNAHASDNGPLELAVFAFATKLIEQLGGAPDWRTVVHELHRPAERRDAGREVGLPVRGNTVH